MKVTKFMVLLAVLAILAGITLSLRENASHDLTIGLGKIHQTWICGQRQLQAEEFIHPDPLAEKKAAEKSGYYGPLMIAYKVTPQRPKCVLFLFFVIPRSPTQRE